MEAKGQLVQEEKWKYIHLLSNRSGRYGDYLLKMMDYYEVSNLQEITEEQARSYWEQVEQGKV